MFANALPNSTTALFVVALASNAMLYSEADVDKAAVEALIEGAYINGAFNDLDTETMRAGFHPVFKILAVINISNTQLSPDRGTHNDLVSKQRAVPAG